MSSIVSHVSPNAQVPSQEVTQVTIHLRGTQFDLLTVALGAPSDAKRAELIGVNPRTIARAREGRIGQDFIARTLYVLRTRADELREYGLTPDFDSLFAIEAES